MAEEFVEGPLAAEQQLLAMMGMVLRLVALQLVGGRQGWVAMVLAAVTAARGVARAAAVAGVTAGAAPRV